MNGKALVKTDPPATSLSEVVQIADMFVKSRFFRDATDVSKAVVKILAGRELGLGPFASMRGFYVTSQGRVEMAANLLASLVRQSGRYDYEIKVHDNEKCEIEFVRVLPDGKTKSLGLSTFTTADAKKAQTQNIEKFPRNMLFARAMSNGQKWFCPDLTNGVAVYVEGETESSESTSINGSTVPVVETGGNAVEAQPEQPATSELTYAINDIQLGVIDDLKRQLQCSEDRWTITLATFTRKENDREVRVTDATQLSATQADELIARLQKGVEAKKARDAGKSCGPSAA